MYTEGVFFIADYAMHGGLIASEAGLWRFRGRDLEPQTTCMTCFHGTRQMESKGSAPRQVLSAFVEALEPTALDSPTVRFDLVPPVQQS